MFKLNEKQRIAVIDDGSKFYSKITKVFDCEVIKCIDLINSYQEALISMITNEHNVYLLNYAYDKNSGLRLLGNAKKGGNITPVIIFSEDIDEKIGTEVLKAGAADYFVIGQTEPTSIRNTVLHNLKDYQFLQELLSNEAKYRSLIETLPVMFYTAEPDPPYNPIYLSKAFENLGYPLEHWFENSEVWISMIHPEDRTIVDNDEDELAENKQYKVDREYRLILKDGSIRWLHDKGQLIRDEHGEPICWQGLIIDITEKKEAENALKESEKRYRDLFENANDLLYIHDLKGNFISFNQTAVKVFGYTREEALRLNLKDIIEPQFIELAKKQIAEKIGGKENSVYEIECKSKQGKRLILEINSRILYQNGVPYAVQGTARDNTEKKKAKQKLIESEERFRDLFENANDLIYTHNLDGRLTSLNRTAELVTGYTRDEAVNMTIYDITAPEFIEKPKEMIKRKLAGDPSTTYEMDIITKDMCRKTMEVSSRLIYENGQPMGVQGIARDVTERNRLINERDRFYELSMDLLATVDSSGCIIQINPSWEKTLFFDDGELIGKNVFSLIYPSDIGEAMKYAAEVRSGQTISFEIRMICKDGTFRWIYWGIIPVPNEKISYAVGRDITQRKLSEQTLEYNAMHDTLTNLPNRAHFLKHLEIAVERLKVDPTYKFAVLFLDLDRFKIVNDSLGHIVGDKLLVAIAERLKTCVRPTDVIARMGGDEFTILVTIKDDIDAVCVAERLQERLTENFRIENYEVFSSASVGIIISDDTDRKPEDFLRDADTAMYRAKETGKARYEIFDREMHVRNMNLLQVETDLRRAIERDEFRVYYQPIVELSSGNVTEFEALIRWQHPEYGLVYPDEFISIAEETGLIIPIGHWILREACEQTKLWQEEFSQPLSISVNLSTKQLLNPNLTKQVKDILNDTKLCPSKLKLEVTESSVMDFSDTAFDVLSELRELGISLSTDDFGTGYSSLSYLHKYPFQRLKIDRSFTGKMEDEKSTAIIRTILILGQNLDIEVVAEGIETEYQLNELIKLGCVTGQGYLFAKPVDKENAEIILLNGLKNISYFDSLKSHNTKIMEIENMQ